MNNHSVFCVPIFEDYAVVLNLTLSAREFMTLVSRADRKAEKRERILQSAIKIFARKGFYNARISEIAREAGVADGTIYLYFKNKDEILITIFEETVGELIKDFRQRLRAITHPVEQIREFARLHLEIVSTHPDLASVLQLELRQSNKFIKEYRGSSLNDYLNLIGEIIQNGQQRKVFRSDIHPAIAKRILFGALDEISTLFVLLKDRSFDLARSAQQIATVFLFGMVDEAHRDRNLSHPN